jgi:CheY-like chemotaxis protein
VPSDCVVLCIDDSADCLFVRKQLLELKGFTVFTATNGRSGIEIARRERVDAVVLDYKMPGMRGDEVAERLRELNPELPIIVLSGIVGELPESIKTITDAQIAKGIEPVHTLIETLECLTHHNADRLPRKRPSVRQQSAKFIDDFQIHRDRDRRKRRRA